MSISNTARIDHVYVSTVASRVVVDMSVDTEHGLDVELDYNRETDASGEVATAYYRVVITPHAGSGRHTSMTQLSPHKIPQLIDVLTEVYNEWKCDVQRTALSGITAESIVLDAQARGLNAADVLAEVLEQLGLSDARDASSHSTVASRTERGDAK